MNAKDKAEELVNKHRMILIHSDTDLSEEIQCSIIAKQCALIAADELEKQEAILLGYEMAHGYSSEYWQEVKQEIEKL